MHHTKCVCLKGCKQKALTLRFSFADMVRHIYGIVFYMYIRKGTAEPSKMISTMTSEDVKCRRWCEAAEREREREYEFTSSVYTTDLMLILMYGILMNVCCCFNTMQSFKWRNRTVFLHPHCSVLCHTTRIENAKTAGARKGLDALLFITLTLCPAKMNCYYFRILWNCMRWFFLLSMLLFLKWQSWVQHIHTLLERPFSCAVVLQNYIYFVENRFSAQSFHSIPYFSFSRSLTASHFHFAKLIILKSYFFHFTSIYTPFHLLMAFVLSSAEAN